MPRSTEIMAIVFIVFGSPIVASLLAIVHPPTQPPLSNAGLAALLVVEPLTAALALALLWARGWQWERFGFRPGWKDLPVGLALFIAAWVAQFVAWQATHALFARAPAGSGVALVSPHLNFGLIVAASIVNPIHEELFVTAYLVTALKELRSPWFAINTSVAIRLTYHLYQGGQGVVGVIAIGLVFAWWYARNGRLWPLVVAHAVFDFVGLMAYQRHVG